MSRITLRDILDRYEEKLAQSEKEAKNHFE